jgi:hypothetical protein
MMPDLTLAQRFEIWRIERQQRKDKEALERFRRGLHEKYLAKLPVCKRVGHDWKYRHTTSAGTTRACARCKLTRVMQYGRSRYTIPGTYEVTSKEP